MFGSAELFRENGTPSEIAMRIGGRGLDADEKSLVNVFSFSGARLMRLWLLETMFPMYLTAQRA